MRSVRRGENYAWTCPLCSAKLDLNSHYNGPIAHHFAGAHNLQFVVGATEMDRASGKISKLHCCCGEHFATDVEGSAYRHLFDHLLADFQHHITIAYFQRVGA